MNHHGNPCSPVYVGPGCLVNIWVECSGYLETLANPKLHLYLWYAHCKWQKISPAPFGEVSTLFLPWQVFSLFYACLFASICMSLRRIYYSTKWFWGFCSSLKTNLVENDASNPWAVHHAVSLAFKRSPPSKADGSTDLFRPIWGLGNFTFGIFWDMQQIAQIFDALPSPPEKICPPKKGSPPRSKSWRIAVFLKLLCRKKPASQKPIQKTFTTSKSELFISEPS